MRLQHLFVSSYSGIACEVAALEGGGDEREKQEILF